MQKHTLPKITDITDLRDKYVLVRTSLNVPIADGEVTNQFRIARALPTINYLVHQGAKVLLIAHIGREKTDTLKPVFDVLDDMLPIQWSTETIGESVRLQRDNLKSGEVLLLENVRQNEGEKSNDKNFAADLAALADMYVNDAFAASHRAHASLVGVPNHLPSYFGMNFIHEYEEQCRVMQPESPSLFILGGAKFDTKMPLVEEYIEKYDQVFIGGALANDVFKAQGFEVGTSLVSDVDLTGNSFLKSEKLLLPVDVTVQGPNGVRVCAPDVVAADEAILDAGPATIEMLTPYVGSAKTILWNGPLGNYEAGYGKETESLGRLIAASDGYAVLGGGDTIAAIEGIGLQEKFGFLSTAGGAMLTFMENGTLPAIDAVMNK